MKIPYIIFMLCFSGCFFYPLKELPIVPSVLGIQYERVSLRDLDSPDLLCWLIKSKVQPPKGAILYLHGNAQNNAYHIGSAAWLTEKGFDVLMLDYRGFGESDGTPTVGGALIDVKRAAAYLHLRYASISRFVFGQSIGATLALKFLSERGNAENFKAAVIESPFAGYRKIAREKIRYLPFVWPLLYPLTWLIDDQDSPERIVEPISIPFLLMHGSDDIVVPVGHSRELLQLMGAGSEFKEVAGVGHLGVLEKREMREEFIKFLMPVL